jgi:hypothetical protein
MSDGLQDQISQGQADGNLFYTAPHSVNGSEANAVNGNFNALANSSQQVILNSCARCNLACQFSGCPDSNSKTSPVSISAGLSFPRLELPLRQSVLDALAPCSRSGRLQLRSHGIGTAGWHRPPPAAKWRECNGL